MTTVLTLIGLVIAAYRIRKGLFTRLEWFVLIGWLVHFGLEEIQMIGEWHRFKYDPRYFRPVDFVTWGWAAWGLGKWWSCVKWLALFGLIAALVYDGVMLAKPNIPGSSRAGKVAACDWAADRIRADWQGPAETDNNPFDLEEYHVKGRPLVWAHVARVPYLLGGCLGPLPAPGRPNNPDYWIDDIDKEDPPTFGYVLLDTFKYGRREYRLYRREDLK